MMYIKTTLIQLLGVLVLFNLCLVLVPRSIRNLILETLKLLSNCILFIFGNIYKHIAKYYKQELNNKTIKKKGTTKKKAVGENATSNVIPFRK